MSDFIVEKLTKSVGDKTVFKEIAFIIHDLDRIGIIGVNGTGKTTLLDVVSERIGFDGDVSPFTKANGYKIAYLTQEPEFDDSKTVLDTVLSSDHRELALIREYETLMADYSEENQARLEKVMAEMDSLDAWSIESEVKTVLSKLGLSDLSQKVGDLSGGLRRRVQLAQVLLNDADLLLLDEPTNHLDLDAIAWLEEFLINFENTVIVVSHDRYFLNKVCTHIADIDYAKIQLYAGNYDFWYESSQLMIKQMKEANKKKEEKIKELQDFIQRFSANASKSKQATSRKRALEKIQLDEIRPSSRKYPYVDFKPDREIGNEVLTVTNLTKTIDGEKVLDHVSFTVGHDDKIAFVGSYGIAATTLFQILSGEMERKQMSLEG